MVQGAFRLKRMGWTSALSLICKPLVGFFAVGYWLFAIGYLLLLFWFFDFALDVIRF